MDSSNYSDDELVELKENAPVMLDPENVKERLWESLNEGVVLEFESMLDGSYCEDNDNAKYTWESVMTSFYGDDFFDWRNEYS